MFAARPTGAPAWRVLIDGQSGAGKTTLGERIQKQTGALLLHVDNWLLGWESLDEAIGITADLLSATKPHYLSFDWETMRQGPVIYLDPKRDWIIEGCGALTPKSAKHADLAIWVETDPAVAKERGLKRDGDSYVAWWDVWNRQERVHWEKNNPRTLADLIVKT